MDRRSPPSRIFCRSSRSTAKTASARGSAFARAMSTSSKNRRTKTALGMIIGARETARALKKNFLSLCRKSPVFFFEMRRYVEAEIAKNRLEELKMHEENRRKEVRLARARLVSREREEARAAGCAAFFSHVRRDDDRRCGRGRSRSGSAWRKRTCSSSSSSTSSGIAK